MSILGEFRTFITKGNVADLAVAVIIGTAFNAVIMALVSDVITPLIGIPGRFDFSSLSLTVNGSVFQIGLFINAMVSFLVIAAVVFFLIVRPISKIEERRRMEHAQPAPDTKQCPECLSQIPRKAKRCMYCTSIVG